MGKNQQRIKQNKKSSTCQINLLQREREKIRHKMSLTKDIDLMESISTSIENDNMDSDSVSNLEDLRKLAQDSFCQQSKSFSENCRKICWAVLGTFWVICYQKIDGMNFPNNALLITPIAAILCLFSDILQYFIDTVYYRNKSNKIYNYLTSSSDNKELNPVQESKNMNKYTNFSIIFF